MTDIQRQAATRMIMTYIDFTDDYVFNDMLDNKHMEMALYYLFVDNIITAEELSREIKVFTGVDVSPLMLRYAAQGIFINMEKGGKQSVQTAKQKEDK